MALNSFLEPAEEAEDGDPLNFDGGDKAIVAQVRQEIAEKDGDIIEVELDDECKPEPDISPTETLTLYINSQVTLDLLKHLRLFHGYLQQSVDLNKKQTKISAFFK
ncbi:hypothetical protein EDC04DRAFT_2906434 [Pisolithus marmoratus]|nr:hypothetical protein EDC04DRAFT_2906434 [Pisolithus marmoratus]